MDYKYLSYHLGSSLAEFISAFIQKRGKKKKLAMDWNQETNSETLGTLWVAFWVKPSKDRK